MVLVHDIAKLGLVQIANLSFLWLIGSCIHLKEFRFKVEF